jgi:hypothetical protein
MISSNAKLPPPSTLKSPVIVKSPSIVPPANDTFNLLLAESNTAFNAS